MGKEREKSEGICQTGSYTPDVANVCTDLKSR